MPRTIKFHLDEHVHPGIAAGLRRRTIDVTTTLEAGLGGADDLAHIAFALSTGRVIVTHDEDFLRLHRQGIPHAGIAYCHQERTLGEIIHHLVLMWEVLNPEDMANKLEYL